MIRLQQDLNELRDQLAESVEGEEGEILGSEIAKQTDANKVLLQEANEAKFAISELQHNLQVSWYPSESEVCLSYSKLRREILSV